MLSDFASRAMQWALRLEQSLVQSFEASSPDGFRPCLRLLSSTLGVPQPQCGLRYRNPPVDRAFFIQSFTLQHHTVV